MILAQGKLYPESEQENIIASLKNQIPETLLKGELSLEKIYGAAERLYQRLLKGEFDALAAPLLAMAHLSHETFLEYAKEFSSEGLRKKVELELGKDPFAEKEIAPGHRVKRSPLGVLFHIAAGNVDFLPAYSVLEGLLAGNINLLKLPSGDKGLSVTLLQKLIEEEPSLAPYIYVFDVPSTDINSLSELAHYSDAVVVWGGDAAVQGVRKLAEANQKIIVWGHKLSFAYCNKMSSDKDLQGLAEDICLSNQMLCSSAQGIYFDSENLQEVNAFAERFLAILQKVNDERGSASLGMRGKSALSLLNEEMEGRGSVHKGRGVSITVYPDSELVLSFLFRNIWCKPLPKSQIVPVLKPYRGYLQSCALLVDEKSKDEIVPLLIKAGLTRIVGPHTSLTWPLESHDGEYALTRYTRLVDIER